MAVVGCKAASFVILMIVTVVHGQICTTEWKLYKDTYYWADVSKRTNDEAKAYCWAMDGNLAMLKSEEVNEFVAGISCRPSTDLYRYWIDMTDKEVEGSFRWGDDTWVSEDMWAPKEPNDIYGQDCVAIIVSPDRNKHGKWSTMRCHSDLYTLCAKPLHLPSLKPRPQLSEAGTTFVLITWPSWSHETDGGDGPITGYMIYLKSEGDEEWNNVGFVKPVKSATTHQLNITRLQADSRYQIMVSLLQRDSGREGESGLALSVHTAAIEPPDMTTPTSFYCPDTLPTSQPGNSSLCPRECPGIDLWHVCTPIIITAMAVTACIALSFCFIRGRRAIRRNIPNNSHVKLEEEPVTSTVFTVAVPDDDPPPPYCGRSIDDFKGAGFDDTEDKHDKGSVVPN